MRIKFLLLVIALWTAACAPALEPVPDPSPLPPDSPVTSPTGRETPAEPVDNPFAPQPGDENLTRGNVFIQEMDILIRESFPPQIALSLSGELPTPCHQLRIQVNDPDAENRINVEVFTVVNPDLACIQVVEPFEANVNLGSFPAGHYSVWVNDELAGEFDS
jgi:hypothetical protein